MFSKGRLRHAVRVLAVAAVLTFIFPGTAGAAGPQPDSSNATTGAQPVGPGTKARDLGYTEAQLQAKLDELNASAAGESGKKPHGIVTMGVSTYPPADSLPGWKTLHQKTNSWCLPAVLESILWYKFGDKYIAGGTYAWQQKIDAIVQKQESKALPWINAQIRANGSLFYYILFVGLTSPTDLARATQYDVVYYKFPSYAAVSVASTAYAWHQNTVARHATLGVGYSGSGKYVSIADPFTSSECYPYCRLGVHPGYSASATYGCTYPDFLAASYFQSLSFPNPVWV